MDTQIKIRGYRVELEEIEAVLNTAPSIRHSAILRCKSEFGDRLAAFIQPDKGYRLEAVKSHLRRTLPEHMIPSEYHELDALPLNANGKIDRAALESEFERAKVSYRCATTGRTDTERALVRIFQEVMGVPVAIADDFFQGWGRLSDGG